MLYRSVEALLTYPYFSMSDGEPAPPGLSSRMKGRLGGGRSEEAEERKRRRRDEPARSRASYRPRGGESRRDTNNNRDARPARKLCVSYW